MASSMGCLTDSLPQLNTSFLLLFNSSPSSHNNVTESRCYKNCLTDCARAVLADGAAAKSEALMEEVLATASLCLINRAPLLYWESVIGELSAIKSTLFDGLALAFHRKLESYGSDHKVLLATSINPKIVGGEKTITFSYL
ncbi:unnamed protein product [Brassica oleracea var. botrytis]